MVTRTRRYLAFLAAIYCICGSAKPGASAAAPLAGDFLGQLQFYRIRQNDTLIELARRFDLGFNEISDANPGVDPFIPRSGAVINVPSAWILPAIAQRPCIVINIPELRLYFLPKEKSGDVHSFPLGIGDEGRDTPLGSYKVVEKIVNPRWYVPKSIRKERASLPAVMPPGPRNPMGSHALRLSMRSILIHGTNKPWGIGRRSSHGCLRLYPEDIRLLFDLVPKGMPVVILNQPVKVASRGTRIYVEAHRYNGKVPGVAEALHLLAERKLLARADFGKVIRAVDECRGYPVEVTLSGR